MEKDIKVVYQVGKDRRAITTYEGKTLAQLEAVTAYIDPGFADWRLTVRGPEVLVGQEKKQ